MKSRILGSAAVAVAWAGLLTPGGAIAEELFLRLQAPLDEPKGFCLDILDRGITRHPPPPSLRPITREDVDPELVKRGREDGARTGSRTARQLGGADDIVGVKERRYGSDCSKPEAADARDSRDGGDPRTLPQSPARSATNSSPPIGAPGNASGGRASGGQARFGLRSRWRRARQLTARFARTERRRCRPARSRGPTPQRPIYRRFSSRSSTGFGPIRDD